METVLSLLLLRFAVVVGAVVVAALLMFTAALVVRRRGGTGKLRRYARPVARTVIGYLIDLEVTQRRSASSRGRARWVDAALRAAARRVADDRNDSPRRTNTW
jgi:hypothetical protein